MELIINGVAKIEAEFVNEDDYFIIRKEVENDKQRESFFDFFQNNEPILINDGDTEWKLVKTTSGYSIKNEEVPYNAHIKLRKYTEEDEKKGKSPDFNTFLLVENFHNRMRIDAIKKILIDKGIVGSEDDFLFNNVFGEGSYYEYIEKYKREFAERMEIDLEE